MELALRLVGLVDVDVLVGDELGECVRDPLEERVETLLGEHLVEDLGEATVRLGRACGDEAHVGPRRRLDGGRVGHAASNLIGHSRNRLDTASAKIRAAMPDGDARNALLAHLIDHAPTFPPASMPVDEALAEDARAAASPHAFMLARLVWPASRLGELPPTDRAISAVLDAPVSADSRVEAIETPPFFDPGAGGSGFPTLGEVYVETPLDEGLEDRLDHLAEHGLRAKVRCGGARVPTAAALAGFVRACCERRLVFKATAGLHHAVRSNGEHGLLNLLAAVLFAGEEEAALWEVDSSAFALDAGSFAWRNRSASADELARVRREVLHSIGSCSFFEPVDELLALGMLPS